MLILASGSPYRRALLERLGLPFASFSPAVDESALPGETPQTLVARLAADKAAAATAHYGEGFAIGSDQVCVCGGEVLGKPGDHARAVAQLQQVSGRRVEFLTAVAVRDLANGGVRDALDVTQVRFRELDDAAIARYLEREPTYDCAGSFKSEGLGVTLVEAIHTEDPTALVGLPMIALTRLLRDFGIEL